MNGTAMPPADEVRKKTLFALFFVVVVVGAGHFAALAFDWYEMLEWFDIPMHFLGGMLAGILVFYFVFSTSSLGATGWRRQTIFLVALLSALLIGLAWEVFEWYAGVFVTQEFWPDTLYDIIMDVAGGGIAALAIIHIREKIHERRLT